MNRVFLTVPELPILFEVVPVGWVVVRDRGRDRSGIPGQDGRKGEESRTVCVREGRVSKRYETGDGRFKGTGSTVPTTDE